MHLSIPTADDYLHALKIQIRLYVNIQTSSVHLGAQIGYNDLYFNTYSALRYNYPYILKIEICTSTHKWGTVVCTYSESKHNALYIYTIQICILAPQLETMIWTYLKMEYNYLYISIFQIRASARTSGTIICTYSECKYMSLLF